MSENEQKIAIAKALGFVCKNCEDPDCKGCWQVDDSYAIPDYIHDANTRPEMLKALSEEEQWNLICLFFAIKCAPSERHFETKLLNLTQPQFAELWMKVKGLWKP